ncbi:hypothetical protein B1B05_12715 [Domibacillus enclensis]|uniref:Uncharacterized protein n=1 Tax=Domibacillus enclensis TaxID=1017273 RepID=A0ABX4E6C3_9BACI|nr:hypothetical protein B1B05_12715 [Domibacillus enclensis]
METKRQGPSVFHHVGKIGFILDGTRFFKNTCIPLTLLVSNIVKELLLSEEVLFIVWVQEQLLWKKVIFIFYYDLKSECSRIREKNVKNRSFFLGMFGNRRKIVKISSFCSFFCDKYRENVLSPLPLCDTINNVAASCAAKKWSGSSVG